MLYIDSCCCLSFSFLLHLYPEYSLPEKHVQQVCWAATLINDERNSAVALEGILTWILSGMLTTSATGLE